jgi:hypothetical protein
VLFNEVVSNWKCPVVGWQMDKELEITPKGEMMAWLRYYLGISLEEQRKTTKKRRIKSVTATPNRLSLSSRNYKEKYLEFITLRCEVHPL